MRKSMTKKNNLVFIEYGMVVSKKTGIPVALGSNDRNGSHMWILLLDRN